MGAVVTSEYASVLEERDLSAQARLIEHGADTQNAVGRALGAGNPGTVTHWKKTRGRRRHCPIYKDLKALRGFIRERRANPWMLLGELVLAVLEEWAARRPKDWLVRRAWELYRGEHAEEAEENEASQTRALRRADPDVRALYRRRLKEEALVQLELAAIDFILDKLYGVDWMDLDPEYREGGIGGNGKRTNGRAS